MLTLWLGGALIAATPGSTHGRQMDVTARNELEQLVLSTPVVIDAPGPLKTWLDTHTQLDLPVIRTFLDAGFTLFSGVNGCVGISWKRQLNADGSGRSLTGYICPERSSSYYMIFDDGPNPSLQQNSVPVFQPVK